MCATPTCSECAHWAQAVPMPQRADRACLIGYRLVSARTPADERCFERLVIVDASKSKR